MAIANRLRVVLASGTDIGSRPDSGGMTLHLPSSADVTPVVKFDAQYWATGATYVSTDKLILTAYNSDTKRTVSYELTYTGNLWEYTPDSTHFDAAGIRPGSSDTWTAQFQLRADTGTGAAPIIGQTDTFTLTVKRAVAVSPAQFGTLAGWWDAWDLTSNTSGTSTIATWSDKSGLERNLVSVNAPTYYVDMIGRPMLRFDGTNDEMATAQSLPASCAILMACRYRAIDATARPAFTFGSAAIAGAYLNTTSPRFTCNATTVTGTGTPNVNETFIIGGYKFDDGAENIVFNHAVGTSAGTETNAPGVLKIGYDATTFTNLDIFEIWAFSAWASGALTTITTFTGNLEDAERALHSKWVA